MPYIIVAAGGSVYRFRTDGTTAALTLPSGVTLNAARPARMAVLGRNVVLVNQGSRSLFISPDQVVYPLGLTPPSSAPVLSSGDASGDLTGTFRAAYTYKVVDPNSGNLLLESAMSPVSAQQTITSANLRATFAVAPDSQVTHLGFYRTQNNGSTLLPWVDVDSNVLTAYEDDLSDTLLAELAANDELGSPPGTQPGTRMTLIVEWKGRLWGVGDVDIDKLKWSASGFAYAWPEDFEMDINPIGADIYGVTGLIRRRDELGVARRNILWKIVGDGGDDGTDFEPIKVVEGKGVWAPDSIKVIRDVAYFLGEDGVYTWGPNGVDCISDEKVRAWFTTDTYFNRAQFENAFAAYNPKYHSYELHLAAAGQTDINRWVSYDIATGVWFGPHLTSAFTPTFAGELVDANNLWVPVMMGSNGHVYTQNRTAHRDHETAITLNAITKAHSGDVPDIVKVFGESAIINRRESVAGNLQIGIAVGDYNASVSKTETMDLRDGQQRLRRLGVGRFARLEFTEATDDLGCEIRGYEIPFFELGQR